MIFDPATFLAMGVFSLPAAVVLLALRDLTRKIWP